MTRAAIGALALPALFFVACQDGTPPAPATTTTTVAVRRPVAAHNDGAFTMRDYRIYREVMTGSGTEEEVIRRIARRESISVDRVKAITKAVQVELSDRNWLARNPEDEIRHASDWNGAAP